MRSLSAYGRGLRFLEGLRDGQEHLVGQVGEALAHLHRLFGREVVLLGQLHRGVVQPLAEVRERLDAVAAGEAGAGALRGRLRAGRARVLPVAFGDAGVPGGLATAALKAAADAGEGELSERGVRLTGCEAASRNK